ncbi:Cruciform DNA binding protein [Dispira simplex]|nr:Cruciform DNA binding protein [Dispira simplex]
MADASHSPQNVANVERVPHTFTWCQGNPDTVIVTGTFDGWSKENVMDRNVVSSEEHNHEGRVQFTKSVQIPVEPSPVLYKYVVDGEWVHDPLNETVIGDDGIINNVLHIQIKSDVQSVQETAVEISTSLAEDVQHIVNTGDREDEAIDLGPVSPVKDETNGDDHEPSNPDNPSEGNNPNVSLTKGESDEVDIGTQSQVESNHAKTDSIVSLSPDTKNPGDNSSANDTVIETPEVSSVSIDTVASPLTLEEGSSTTEVPLPATDDHVIPGIQKSLIDHIEVTVESSTATPSKTEEGPIAATVEKPATEVEQAPVESPIQESIETPGTDETAADEAPQPTPQECAVDDIKESSQSVVSSDDVAPTVGSPEITDPVDAGLGVEAEIAIVQAELLPQVAGDNVCQDSSPTTSKGVESEKIVANVPLVDEEGTSNESIPSQAEASVISVDTTPPAGGCSDEVELTDTTTVAEDVVYEVDNSAPCSQGDSEEAASTPEPVIGVVEDGAPTMMESNEEPESVKVERLPEEPFEAAEESLKSVNPVVEVELTEQNQTITEPAEFISLGEVKDESASAEAEVSISEDNIVIQDKEAETTESTAKVLPEAESAVPEITEGEITTAVAEEVCSPVAVEESTAVVAETETNDDSVSERVEENMAEVHPTEDGQQVSVEVLPLEVVETTQTPTHEIPLDECHPSEVVEETPAVDPSTLEKCSELSGEVVPDESSAMESEEREKIPIVEEQHTKQPLFTTSSAEVHSNHVDPEAPSDVVADTALNGKLISDEPNVVTSTPSEDGVSSTEMSEPAEEPSEKLDFVIDNGPTVEDQSTHEAAEITGGAVAAETGVMVPEPSQKETIPVIMEDTDVPAVVKESSEESQANDGSVTELVQENQVKVDTAEGVADRLAKSDLVEQTEISENHAEESAAFEIVEEHLTVVESPTELVAQPSDGTLPVPTEVSSSEIAKVIPTDASEIIETREPEGLPVTEESPVKEIQPATGNPGATSDSDNTEITSEKVIEGVDEKDLVIAESTQTPVESSDTAEESSTTVDSVVNVPAVEDQANNEAVDDAILTVAIGGYASSVPEVTIDDADVPEEESQDEPAEAVAELKPEADIVVHEAVEGEDTSPTVVEFTDVAQPAEELVVQAVNGDQVEVSPAEAVTEVTKEEVVTESPSEQVVEVVDEKDLAVAESVDTHVEPTESAGESSKAVESVVPAVEDDRSTETIDDAVPADATEETTAALPGDMVAEANVFGEPSEVTAELTPEAQVVVSETVVETVPVMVDDANSPAAIEEVSEEPQLIEDLVIEPVNGDQAEISTSEEVSVVSQEVVLTETPSEVVVKVDGCKDLVVSESNEAPAGSTELAANSAKPIDAVLPAVEDIANAEAMHEVVPTTASDQPIAAVPEVVIVSEADGTVENSEDEPMETAVEESSETVKEEVMPVVMVDTTSPVFVEETPEAPQTCSESVMESVEENPLDATATEEVTEVSAVCDTAPVVDAIGTLAEEVQVDSSVNPEVLPVTSEEVEVAEESSVSLDPTVTSSDVVIEPVSLLEEAAVPEIVENTAAVEASPTEVAAESSDETLPVPTEFTPQEAPEVVPTDDSVCVESQEPEELPVADVCPAEETQPATGNPDVTLRSVDAEPSSEEVVDDFDNNDFVAAESTEAPEGSADPAEETSTTENAVVKVPTLEENANNQTANEAVPVEATEDSVPAIAEVSTSEAEVVVDTSQDELVEGTAEVSSESGTIVPEPVGEGTGPVILEAKEVSQSVENVAVEPVNDDQEEVSTVEEDSGITEEVVTTETPSEGMVEDVDNKDLVLAESTEVSAESTKSEKEPWKTVESVVDVPAVDYECDAEIVANAIPTESTEEPAIAIPEVVTANAEVPVEESEGETIETTTDVTPGVEIVISEAVELETDAAVVESIEVPRSVEALKVEPVNDDQVEASSTEEVPEVPVEVVIIETPSEEVVGGVDDTDMVVAGSTEALQGSAESAKEFVQSVNAVVPAAEDKFDSDTFGGTVENSEDEPVEAAVESNSEIVEAMPVVMEDTTSPVFVEETLEAPQTCSESVTEPVEEDSLDVTATEEVTEVSAVCDTAPVGDAIGTLAEEVHVDSSVNPEVLPVASEEVEVAEESPVPLEPTVTSSDVVIEPVSLLEEAAVPEIVENTPAVEASPTEVVAESSDETLPVPTEFTSQEAPEVVPTDGSELVESQEPEGLSVADVSPAEETQFATSNPDVTLRSVDADHSSEEVVEDPAGNETVVEAITAVAAQDPVGAVPRVIAEADVAVEYVQNEPSEAPVELTPEAKTVVPETVEVETVPLAVEVTGSPVLAEEASEEPQPVDDLAIEPVNGDQLEISALESDSEVSAEVVAMETPVNVVQVESAENPEQTSPTSEEVEVAVDPSNSVEVTALPSDSAVGTADKPEEVAVPEIVDERNADGSVDEETVSTALENALQKSSSDVEHDLSTSVEAKESEVVSSTEVNPTEDLQPVTVETLSETVVDDIVEPDEAPEEVSELAEKSPEVIDLISEVEPVVEDQPDVRIVRQVAPINTTDAAVDVEAELSPPADCISFGKAQAEAARSSENSDESRSVIEAAGFATTCTDSEERNTLSSDAITEPIEGFVESATPEIAEQALAADSISNSATSNPTDETSVTSPGIDAVETAEAVPVKYIMTECEETMDIPATEGGQTNEPQSIAENDESILDPVFGENSSDVVDDIVADENVISAEPRICPLLCDDQSTQVERSAQAQLSSEVIDSVIEAEPVEKNHPIVQPVNEIHTAVVTDETHTAAPEELLTSDHIAVRAEAEETSGNAEYLDINSVAIGNGQEREASIGGMDSEIVSMTEAISATRTVMETVSIAEPETLQPEESEVAAIVSPEVPVEVTSTYPETKVDESHVLSLTECEQLFNDEAEAERTSAVSGIEPVVDSLVPEVSTVVDIDKCTTEPIAEVIHTAVDPPPTSEASVPTENVGLFFQENVETREVRDFNDGADHIKSQDLVEEEQDLTLDSTPDVNKNETVEDTTRSESEAAVVTEQLDNKVIESHSLVDATVNEACSNSAAVKTVPPCTIQTNDVTEETKPGTEATPEVESAISMEPTVMVDHVKPDNDVKDDVPCEVVLSATEAECDFVMVETPSDHGVEECAKDKEVATDTDSACPPCAVVEPDATPSADQVVDESPLEEQRVPLDEDAGDKPTEDVAELPRFNEQVVNETIQPATADEPLQEPTDALPILDSELPTEDPTVLDESLQGSVEVESPVDAESQPETVPSECDIEHTSDAAPETPSAVEMSAPAPVPTSTEVSENSMASDQSPVVVTPVTTDFPVDENFMSSHEKADTASVLGNPPKVSDTEATTAETGGHVHDVGGDYNSSPSVAVDVASSRDAPAEQHEISDNTENALCSEQSLHELESVKPLDTTPTAPDEPVSTTLWEENQSSVVSLTANVTTISIEESAVVTAPEVTETEECSVALPPAEDESSELPAVADQVKESPVESLEQSAANHTVTSEVKEDDLPRDAEESEPLVDVRLASSTSAVPITPDISSDLPDSFAASDSFVVEPADQESAAVAETVTVEELIVSKDTPQPGKDEIGNMDSSTVIVPADAVKVSSLTEEIPPTPALALPSYEGEEVNAIKVEEQSVVHIVHKDEALITEHSDVQRDSEVTPVEEKIATMAVDQETQTAEERTTTAVDEQQKEAVPTTDTSKLYEADDRDGQESVASFTTADEGHDDKHHMDSLELDEDRPIPFPSPSRDSTDSAIDVNEPEDEPSKADASVVDVIEAPTEGDLATATQTPDISKAPSISSKISKRRRRRSSVWKRLKGWFTG